VPTRTHRGALGHLRDTAGQAFRARKIMLNAPHFQQKGAVECIDWQLATKSRPVLPPMPQRCPALRSTRSTPPTNSHSGGISDTSNPQSVRQYRQDVTSHTPKRARGQVRARGLKSTHLRPHAASLGREPALSVVAPWLLCNKNSDLKLAPVGRLRPPAQVPRRGL
jgi:hypothetical protein